jgi:hypothetical protein
MNWGIFCKHKATRPHGAAELVQPSYLLLFDFDGSLVS